MGPEQWLFLQWHEHKGSLVSMFEKLFERNTFVDCTLAAEGQYLNVHKVILSACSPYFELLLNENRDKHPIIILKDVKFRSLKSIIEYMYRGEANVLSSDIKDFLAAAESLQIKGIGKHGGDTKHQPNKALQDFVEGEGRSPHSPKTYPSSGENDKRTVTDFHEIKSDDEDDESGRDKNYCYIENVEHLSNTSPQKIPVPIITSEANAESQWLKAESSEDTAQYLMSMPTLNIGACTTDFVHPGLKETVPERTTNKASTQNVLPCDVQMKKADMSRSETKCELQPASPIVDNEVADSVSQASSVRDLSDTAEEWAEEEMEEALTHSHTTGNSAVGGTDESRAHFDGGSDATRESRDLGSDQQESEKYSHEISVRLTSSRGTIRSPSNGRENEDDKSSLTATTVPPKTAASTRLSTPASFVSRGPWFAPKGSAHHRHVCPECSKTFPWLSALKEHLMTHRGDKVDDSKIAARKPCDLAAQQRSRAVSPVTSTRSVRGTSFNPRTNPLHDRIQSLDRVSAKSRLRPTSRQSLVSLHPTYKCQQCGAEFPVLRKYVQHVYKSHGTPEDALLPTS